MPKNAGPGRRRKKWIWWVICPVFSVLLFAYLFWKQGGLAGMTGQEILRFACDGCFVCGLIFGVLYVINLCAYWGAFDFLQYSARLLSDSLFSGKDRDEEREHTDFADFVDGKNARRRLNIACLVYAAVFLLAGAALLVWYMN